MESTEYHDLSRCDVRDHEAREKHLPHTHKLLTCPDSKGWCCLPQYLQKARRLHHPCGPSRSESEVEFVSFSTSHRRMTNLRRRREIREYGSQCQSRAGNISTQLPPVAKRRRREMCRAAALCYYLPCKRSSWRNPFTFLLERSCAGAVPLSRAWRRARLTASPGNLGRRQYDAISDVRFIEPGSIVMRSSS